MNIDSHGDFGHEMESLLCDEIDISNFYILADNDV